MKLKFIFAFVLILIMCKVHAQPANFSINGSLCVNNQIAFINETSEEIDSWLWDFGDGSTSNLQYPTHEYTEQGTYTIQLSVVSNGNNYTHSETEFISANPTADFMVDSTIVWFSSYSRVFFDNSTSPNPITNYIWNFGDNTESLSTKLDSTLYKYANNGTYQVWLKVIDSHGCIDSISNSIEIHDRFYVPNVFTPNNDLINDEFIVTSNGTTLFSIEIYSRWGNMVFKRDNQEQIIWDGHIPDGTKVKPGTYYYVLNAKEGDVNYNPEKGFITVFY